MSMLRALLCGLACSWLMVASTAAADTGTVHTEAIAAQPLAQALNLFATQTGLQVIYVSEITQGIISHSVPAGLSAQTALSELLKGSGLQFEFINARTVRILAPGAPRSNAEPIAFSRTSDTRTSDVDNVRLAQNQNNSSSSGRTEATASSSMNKMDDVSHPPLGEIIVTATKREESLSKVPVSIAALSADAMAESGIKSFRDVANIPPNPSTNVLNARVSAAYGQFEVEAFLNNLLNSTPLLNRGQDTIASDLFYRTTLRPRTIGLGAYWHF